MQLTCPLYVVAVISKAWINGSWVILPFGRKPFERMPRSQNNWPLEQLLSNYFQLFFLSPFPYLFFFFWRLLEIAMRSLLLGCLIELSQRKAFSLLRVGGHELWGCLWRELCCCCCCSWCCCCFHKNVHLRDIIWLRDRVWDTCECCLENLGSNPNQEVV